MPYLEIARVLRHDCVGPGLHEMECLAPRIAAAAAPGQFAHVNVHPVQGVSEGTPEERALAANSAQPLLRRPLSIFDVAGRRGDADGARITFLYKVRGAGTALLADVRPGDCLNIMGPLGSGFSLPAPVPGGHGDHAPAHAGATCDRAPHALLIGGGVGIAPLVYLARALAAAGCRVTVFYGANTASEMQAVSRRLLTASAEGRIEVFTTTLDGSSGRTGIVTDLLTAEQSASALERIDFVYTCGPEPMMASVERFATARGIPGEMSLETTLACGVGACLGCARRLKANGEAGPVYARVCKDGPVFSMGQVELGPVVDREEESK